MFHDEDEVPYNVRTQRSYQVFAAEKRKFFIKHIRSLVAFFFLGLCNNFAGMALMAAAEDIMEINTVQDSENITYLLSDRHCANVSTGVILLAYIITATIVSFIVPFLPWFLHMRIFLSIVFTMVGFCIISLAKMALTVALFGIVLVAIGGTLGEASCLQYTAYFHVNVISTWSSGTGIADVDTSDYANNNRESIEEDEKQKKKLRIRYYRALAAFWILGICNNFGITAMLVGAEDIIEINQEHVHNSTKSTSRDCTISSTGVVLVVQYVVAVVTTLIAPFIPMVINCRVFACLSMYVAGFVIIAFVTELMTVAMVAVALVSISSALGEVTFLQYSSYFRRGTLSTYSSGTGAAGVLGALSYTLGIKQGYQITMLAMISVPIVMGLVFWLLLPIPTEEDKHSVAIQRAWNEGEMKSPWVTIVKKYYLIPKVLYKYIAPLGSVYMFEYFINQGLYEIMKVEDNLVQKHMQYQWLQVAYQIGVFISRSSVNCLYIKCLWIMPICQFINVIIFTTNAVFLYIRSFWLLFALAIEEGLIGGAAYVNTFVKIGREEAEEEKQFMSSMTCFGNNAGIMLAGFLAILAHNLICKLPPPDNI